MRDYDGEGVLGLVRLDPAEIASIYPLDNEDRSPLALDQVPPLLIAGIQAVEDRNFKHHHGIDPRGIARAAWANLRNRAVVQGGSTLTQQLVKNMYLDQRQTLLRKANEAAMAVLLELHYDKSDILEAYFNEIFLGQQGAHAIHGFARAAEFYFDQPLDQLDTAQVALLVALAKGASWYNPRRNPERALARRNEVLAVFHETGLIDQASLAEARAEPLGVTPGASSRSGAYPAFIDLVRRQLRSQYRESDLMSEGLRIFTTLEPATQRAAEAGLSEGLDDLGQRGLPAELQGASVVLDIHSGEVQALVGDRYPQRRGFNRALDARRQVGSVVKPLLYWLALQHPQQFTLLTRVSDEPLSMRLANGDTWQPGNYDGQSHGDVTLLDALVHSYNLATVRVGQAVGAATLAQSLGQFPLDIDVDAVPALFLGAVELTPLEVAQIYQALAAGGFTVPLRAVTDVLDSTGQSLSRYPLRLAPLQNRDSIALTDYAMHRVTTEGTARSLAGLMSPPVASAGKTGTTNDRRDSWYVGYTRNRLAVAWVGLDDNRPAGVTGANAALRVWARTMNPLPLESRQPELPEGVQWHWVQRHLGLLSDESCPGAERMPFLDNSALPAADPCLAQKEQDDESWWNRFFDDDG